MITTKEVQKAMSTDLKIKDVKMKLDVVSIQEDGDMGTADALRHIQPKIKVRMYLCVGFFGGERGGHIYSEFLGPLFAMYGKYKHELDQNELMKGLH